MSMQESHTILLNAKPLTAKFLDQRVNESIDYLEDEVDIHIVSRNNAIPNAIILTHEIISRVPFNLYQISEVSDEYNSKTNQNYTELTVVLSKFRLKRDHYGYREHNKISKKLRSKSVGPRKQSYPNQNNPAPSQNQNDKSFKSKDTNNIEERKNDVKQNVPSKTPNNNNNNNNSTRNARNPNPSDLKSSSTFTNVNKNSGAQRSNTVKSNRQPTDNYEVSTRTTTNKAPNVQNSFKNDSRDFVNGGTTRGNRNYDQYDGRNQNFRNNDNRTNFKVNKFRGERIEGPANEFNNNRNNQGRNNQTEFKQNVNVPFENRIQENRNSGYVKKGFNESNNYNQPRNNYNNFEKPSGNTQDWNDYQRRKYSDEDYDRGTTKTHVQRGGARKDGK